MEFPLLCHQFSSVLAMSRVVPSPPAYMMTSTSAWISAVTTGFIIEVWQVSHQLRKRHVALRFREPSSTHSPIPTKSFHRVSICLRNWQCFQVFKSNSIRVLRGLQRLQHGFGGSTIAAFETQLPPRPASGLTTIPRDGYPTGFSFKNTCIAYSATMT